MGILDMGPPDWELVCKYMIINSLNWIDGREPFHFGTDREKRKNESDWELEAKSFPYQELRGSVPVWHATCIRRGQKTQETGNREQGSEVWHR
jgi:hypothetical protein